MRRFSIFISFFLSCQSLALDIPVSITGEVVIPPCSVNNGTQIEVTFSPLLVNKINGKDFSKTISIPFDCAYFSGSPYVSISGDKIIGAPDNVLLATVDEATTQGFGLAIYQGSVISEANSVKLGVKTLISTSVSGLNEKSGRLTLTAVPWKRNDWSQTGAFTAIASVSISYM